VLHNEVFSIVKKYCTNLWITGSEVVRLEVNFKDDKKHGSATSFKEDESILKEDNYKNGELINE